jgi:hypothetical protein
MIVMYAASKGKNQPTLNLEREITDLQRRANASTGQPVDFQFFPDLAVEVLPIEVAKVRPDILHISSHQISGLLSMAKEDGTDVRLTADMLSEFLNTDYPPKLVYLSACNSDQIAKDLVGRIPMAIGTTAPITNGSARSSAVRFYDWLMNGRTVREAFQVGRKMTEALSGGAVSSVLCEAPGNPGDWILHHVTRIVARFRNRNGPQSSRENYRFELGLIGCPRAVVQTIFFTDDESYILSDDTHEEDLCLVIRGSPGADGVMWSGHDYWRAVADHRIFACSSTSSGHAVTVSSTLCEAIHANLLYLERQNACDFAEDFQAALTKLREWDRPEPPKSVHASKRKNKKNKNKYRKNRR